MKDRNTNPLEFGYYLQDLLTRAEVETKRKDQARVIKYYRALAAAIPEEAQGWSLLCEAYQTAGDRERALRACKYAIDRKGVQIKTIAATSSSSWRSQTISTPTSEPKSTRYSLTWISSPTRRFLPRTSAVRRRSR